MREWLKELRKKNGMSQIEAAEALNMKQSSLSMIERAERQKKMSLEMARKISKIFDIPIETILEKESEG